jgi:hypothetical protein
MQLQSAGLLRPLVAGSRQDTRIDRVKHPNRLDIPTPRCDRYDATLLCTAAAIRYSIGRHEIPSRPVMSSLPLKLVSAFALASPADAKTRKHKNTAVTSETAYGPHYWGTNLVRRGPLYFSSVYLGDDPDPNIRFQILRDISGRFGGDSN